LLQFTGSVHLAGFAAHTKSFAVNFFGLFWLLKLFEQLASVVIRPHVIWVLGQQNLEVLQGPKRLSSFVFGGQRIDRKRVVGLVTIEGQELLQAAWLGFHQAVVFSIFAPNLGVSPSISSIFPLKQP
jgi:hypothetical protein